jgi:glycosyltransferase involved in cell wall biosynthesis
VGYVVESSATALAEALERIYDGDNLARFARNMVEERKRFTWSAMCDKIEELYDML